MIFIVSNSIFDSIYGGLFFSSNSHLLNVLIRLIVFFLLLVVAVAVLISDHLHYCPLSCRCKQLLLNSTSDKLAAEAVAEDCNFNIIRPTGLTHPRSIRSVIFQRYFILSFQCCWNQSLNPEMSQHYFYPRQPQSQWVL